MMRATGIRGRHSIGKQRRGERRPTLAGEQNARCGTRCNCHELSNAGCGQRHGEPEQGHTNYERQEGEAEDPTRTAGANPQIYQLVGKVETEDRDQPNDADQGAAPARFSVK